MYPTRSRDYFDRCFGLLAPCFAARAWCFRWFAKFVCVCFCAACFCFCFGDLSPMTFTLPRHRALSADHSSAAYDAALLLDVRRLPRRSLAEAGWAFDV